MIPKPVVPSSKQYRLFANWAPSGCLIYEPGPHIWRTYSIGETLSSSSDALQECHEGRLKHCCVGRFKLEDNRQTDVSAVPKLTSKLIGGGGRRSKGAENVQWKAGQSSKDYGKFAVSVATGNQPKRGFLNGRQSGQDS